MEREYLKQLPQSERIKHFIEASRDLIATHALLAHLEAYKIRSNGRNFIMSQVAKGLFEGQERSIAKDARFIFGEYKREISGAFNIPNKGPVLFIANHWARGPLKGYWATFSLNEQVFKLRNDEPRWIKQNSLDMPIFGSSIEAPFSRRSNDLGSVTYHNILVENPRSEGHKNNNGAKGGLTALKVFKSGGMIGLYPEARVSTSLLEGNIRAGFMAYALAKVRPDALICPVGEYSDRLDNLFLNIGEAFSACDILNSAQGLDREERDRVVANLLMSRIAPLVPQWMRKKV